MRIVKNFVTAGSFKHPIYVSTGALVSDGCADNIVKSLSDYGISNIELSSGARLLNRNSLQHSKSAKYLVHNYFPRPEKDIVLNLASSHSDSIKFIKKSIKLSVDLGSEFYSAHAGFVSNFKPSDLGNIASQKMIDNPTEAEYASAENTFISNVLLLNNYCKTLGINFLIENNGVSIHTVKSESDTPKALLVKPSDVERLIYNIPELNILFDVAHAKISGKAFGFNPRDLLSKSKDHIRCFHLSDNDSNTDSNSPISSDSWFIEDVKKILIESKQPIPIVLEVYRLNPEQVLDQCNLIASSLSTTLRSC